MCNSSPLSSRHTDPFFGPIIKDVTAGQRDDFLLHDGFLFKGNQLSILEGNLLLKTIQELGNKGHIGRDKTFKWVATNSIG